MKELILTTQDHIPLSVRIFEPELSNAKLVLINSATGVKQHVYFSFSKYLAELGYTVITYDYRGIGESKPEKLSGYHASMRIWGTVDYRTLTEFIKENYSGFTKFCIGHSVGALILGMNPHTQIFKKLVFVTTQDAYYGNLNLKVAATAILGFGIALPVLTGLLGYFPANLFGLGESLPKGVAYDWQTLILNRKSTARLYEKIEKNYAAGMVQDAFVMSAEDDPWVTEKGMKRLMNNIYPNLNPLYREVKVTESDKGEIGHINFFRSFNRPLWKIIAEELH